MSLLAEVSRWKAMLDEERERHAAERSRDAERTAAALEAERRVFLNWSGRHSSSQRRSGALAEAALVYPD